MSCTEPTKFILTMLAILITKSLLNSQIQEPKDQSINDTVEHASMHHASIMKKLELFCKHRIL